MLHHLLICFSVFVFILVVEHREIRLVTALGNVMVFNSLQYRTARLMGVGTVRETALLGVLEDFLEIAGQLLTLHIKCAEALNAWRVDDIGGSPLPLDRRSLARQEPPPTGGGFCATLGEPYHLTKRRGMLTREMGIADFGCAEIGPRHQTVDDGGLPHPTIAAEQGDLTFKERAQFLDTYALFGRNLAAFVADVLIETDHHLLVTEQVVVEQICLIENQDHRHTISLSRSQEAVNERGGCFRTGYGDYQESLVNVSRQDMALLRQVDALTDNIVATVLDIGNKPTLSASQREGSPDCDAVANSHRVRAADTFYTKFTLYLTIK